MPTYDYTGKVVLITGCARGQGLSHALYFGKAGAIVVGIDIKDKSIPGVPYKLSTTKDFEHADLLFKEQNIKGKLFEADVLDEISLKKIADFIENNYTKVDFLVCNAGINAISLIENTSADIINNVIDVNLKGIIYSIKHFTNLLRKSEAGKIICIASLTTQLGAPFQTAYASSKAGILGLIKALAIELGQYNICVNAISPTLVDTPQFHGLNEINKIDLNKLAPQQYLLPNLKILRSEDVSKVLLWLCSEDAKFITGQNIILDGGKMIK